MLNALKYIEDLEKSGFTREQAEGNMKALIEMMSENFATKIDLKELEWKLDSRMQGIESSVKELEYKLTIKLGSMMALSIGVAVTLVKLITSVGH